MIQGCNIMAYERIYTKEPLPDFETIRSFIGEPAIQIFDQLIAFLDGHYDFTKEIYFGGKSYGVMVRYRKNGKTLLGIFPERDGFSIVLVYGKKEVETFEEARPEFSDYICKIFDTTKQYHDGRWLLIRIEDARYFDELIKMIKIKKKPKK